VVALFVLPYNLRQSLIISMIGTLACLSLVLLTGFVGQISLVQFGMAGVAGVILSKLSTDVGLGWPWAPLIAIVGATVLGVLMALPALRVRGVQLAILTLAGAVALNSFGFGNPTFGVPPSGAPVPQPTILGFSIGTQSPLDGLDGARPSPLFGIGVLLVVTAAAVVVANIRRTNLGKRMLAVRSNERAAAGVGISPARVKLVTFAISAVIMALAGILYSYNFSSLDPTRFTVFNSLSLIAIAYLGGITTVRGAVISGLMIAQGLISYVLNHYVGISVTVQLILAGVLLVVTIVTSPDGVALSAPAPRWPRRWDRRGGKSGPPRPGEEPVPSPRSEPVAGADAPVAPELQADGYTSPRSAR
jgi:branched-chain amino acid transport system permease protein